MNATTNMRHNAKTDHLSKRQADAKAGARLENSKAMRRESVLLTEALRGAQDAPDFRENKVAAIKAQIAAGTYAMDNLELAEALLRENPGLFRV